MPYRMLCFAMIGLVSFAIRCYVYSMAGRKPLFPPVVKLTDGTFSVVVEDRAGLHGSYGNRYRCRWWYRGKKRKEKRFASAAEGKQFADTLWRSYQLGTLDGQEHARPSTYSAAVEAFATRKGLSPHSTRNYRLTLRRFSDFLGAKRQVQNIHPHDVRTFLAQMDPNLSPASLARYARDLKAFFNYAMKWGWITSNPASTISIKVPATQIQYIPKHLWEVFLAACTPAHAIRCRFLLWTGVRSGEMINAKWSWVEQSGDGFIFKITPDNETNWKPKWGSARQIPLSYNAIKALQLAQGQWSHGQYIFGNHRLTAWNSLRETFDACRKSGIPRVKTHALRSSYATWMLSQGVDLITLARLLGHKDITMLQKHYAGFNTKHLQDTIQRIDQLDDEVNMGTFDLNIRTH